MSEREAARLVPVADVPTIRHHPLGRPVAAGGPVLPDGHHTGVRRADLVMRAPGGHLARSVLGAAASWARFVHGPTATPGERAETR
jgi:hypothetical protein